ncbi:UDP-N-acetylglucosamine 2-epimerase (hydrolyzing) [Subdoligranulum sp. DSM 109015]|uniref:UDP-N-acetylglucosamine 2-epimerase (Hydrolyzing) n=1 Tax=Gemmiger gallinarum TaxID=2779354 RepID=A0ABR9R5P6_9FIRM|nr:UDP-N-acetylglucosamine 2-epimerase [Gemmiger gallinarum]MBE5038452.1 UDP-N-acetylglucosamine 2-epimerase (hydrolyzing) [Gemmiger gallinarum]
MSTVAVVTATRAEYGLLRPVIGRLAAGQEPGLRLVVTGAHLSARLGATVSEIEADGFPIDARLPIFSDDPAEPVARTIARTMTVFDDYFAARRPDAVLLLGDRFEIFAVAAAAAARHIPIAHISGGDVTLGAADEYYRHCISKMAALHFPSCADSAARLVRMGEEPGRVFCVGGLGDQNIRTLPKMTRQELCSSTGFDLMQPFALVTFHPETGANAPDPAVQSAALCQAMEAVKGVFWLITGSNADAGGEICSAAMRSFAAAHPDRAGFVQSLGLKRYLSAMEYASLVAGNSSSGVVETPSFRVPAVNIGSRQAGRILCTNVISCGGDAGEIEAALRRALSPEFAALAKTARSPYNGGDTAGKIVRVLAARMGTPAMTGAKTFYAGPVPAFDPLAEPAL